VAKLRYSNLKTLKIQIGRMGGGKIQTHRKFAAFINQKSSEGKNI